MLAQEGAQGADEDSASIASELAAAAAFGGGLPLVSEAAPDATPPLTPNPTFDTRGEAVAAFETAGRVSRRRPSGATAAAATSGGGGAGGGGAGVGPNTVFGVKQKLACIFKVGDDVRQDVLALQVGDMHAYIRYMQCFHNTMQCFQQTRCADLKLGSHTHGARSIPC